MATSTAAKNACAQAKAFKSSHKAVRSAAGTRRAASATRSITNAILAGRGHRTRGISATACAHVPAGGVQQQLAAGNKASGTKTDVFAIHGGRRRAAELLGHPHGRRELRTGCNLSPPDPARND